MPDEPNQSILIPVDIEAEMKKSYLDYSMSVIIGRALPDVRDGLKPVHRRILFGMYELGLTSTRPYRKCAKIVGEVLGKYHPHGDTPVYDALVRMAQGFNMRYPLVDGQGNFGSVDGDMPAAMRYTEARLSRIAEELLAAIEEVAKDRENIVITEIPYQVNKATLIKRIAELAQTKKVEGIADVRDESDREGMRIVVELKRGEESQLILNNLYKHTQMQESFGMILLAIAGGQPKEMGLLEFIRLFIEHRRDVVLRRTRYDLRKAREREHILVGYQVALDHLDDVIRIIRGSEGRAEAKQNLLNFFSEQDVTITENGKSRKISGVKLDGRKYKLGGVEGETARTVTGGLTPVQVDAILELQLHRLTQLSVDEIIKELKTIRERIVELEEVLSSEKRLKSVISSELKEVQKQYGDDRRTQIVDKVDEIKLEDLIADTDMLITVSHAGYVKRTPVEIYRHQSRGGKGRIGARTKEEDFVEHLFIASAHSYILLFTTKGRVYWLKVYEIPEAAAATRGKAISSLVRFQEDEKLSAIVAAHSLEDEGKYVFFATRNGTAKKSALKEFSNPRPSGIIAINLEAKDEMIGAKLSDGKKMIFLASHEGQAILFRETEVRPMGRNAGGVIGMDLAKGDYVVSMDAVQPDFEILAKEHKTTTQDLEELENEQIKDSLTSLMLTVSEKGYGKRTLLAEYRITSRGGKGVVNMKTTDRNGSVVAALQVTEESDVMIITHNGKVIRVHANEIREAGRSTQGVRLLRLDDDDSVAAAAVLQEESEEERK